MDVMTPEKRESQALSLKPIPIGKAAAPKRMVFYQSSSEEMVEAAQYAWLVRGSRKNILIDCGGILDIERMKAHGLDVEDMGEVDESLKRMGLFPEDIDIIIATHLHAEHISSAKKFPKAKIIVQKQELIGALKPCPVLEWMYLEEVIKPLFEANRFEIVDGDLEIEPGIEVMLTPGHSAGGQSVVLHSGGKKIIVTGFCCADENMFPPDPKQECILMSLHENLPLTYQSMVKVKRLADIVVPLHEARFINVDTIP